MSSKSDYFSVGDLKRMLDGIPDDMPVGQEADARDGFETHRVIKPIAPRDVKVLKCERWAGGGVKFLCLGRKP